MNLIGQTGFVIFQGHNSIWSKKTLEAIGPWLETHKGEPMIVEDVAAAVRAYFKGFYGKSIWVESGEWVPTSLRECEAMWMRWTYGNLQITHKYIGKICSAATMSFKEKMDILNQMFSFSYILTPIFAVLAIIQPHASAFWLAFMVLTQLPSFLYIIGYSRHNKPQSVSWIKWITQLYLAFFVMSTFINWVSTKAVFNYVTRRSQGWKPTGKTAEAYISWKAAISSRKGLFAFAIAGLTLFIVMVSHLTNSDKLTTNELVFMSPSVLFFINMALVIAVFGRSRMQEQGNITMMSIENDHLHQQKSVLNSSSNPLKKAS